MTINPAFIAIDDEGHITLYWGDGTEEEKYVLLRGPRASTGQQLIEDIETLTTWAEDRGYTIVVPSYDLEVEPDALADNSWDVMASTRDPGSDIMRFLDEVLDAAEDDDPDAFS